MTMMTMAWSHGVLLFAVGILLPARLVAAVEHDAQIPQLEFAAQELERVLTETGRQDLKVTLVIQSDETSAESFRVRLVGQDRIEVIGSDATGTMYGGLEVADLLRLGLSITDQQHTPFIEKRGIKFNIPWDARTPSYDDTGDSAQNNIEAVWDFEFWKAYLDDLARYRYNVLSLWSTHPYSNLVKLDDYPDASMDDVYRLKDGLLKPEFNNKLRDLDQNGDGYLSIEHDSAVLELVKKMTIDEKIAHWQKVFQYAADRGIEVQLFHWTVFAFGAIDKHGITEDQTNPITVDYLRKCVKQALLTYPNLATIGVCAGENADRAIKGEHSTENYIFNTFGLGIMDAQKVDPNRKVRFIFRRHATEEPLVTEAFQGRYTGGILDVSVKYAVAHMYSSRRPQEWERRIVSEGWLNHYKAWLNLRNDDILMHRWGSQDYVREFIKWMPREHSPGFYMGSDGYVWARESVAKNPEMAGRLEIDKHWYQFRLWGQLAYNNELGRDYWEAVLSHRFPGIDAKLLYAAWEATSEVIPQLNRSSWSPTDAEFEAEGCMHRGGFLTLDEYYFNRDPMPLERIENAPDPQCLSVTEWATAFLAGNTKNWKGLTPLQVADNLDGYAATAQASLPELRSKAGDNAELQETLNDIDSMAFLGRYFADKMRGAAKLAIFRQDRKQKQFHAEAVKHLEDAVAEWKAYAAILTPQYKTQLLARTSFLDWNSTLAEVEKEVETVRQEGIFPEVRFANLRDGAELPAGSDLRVEVEAMDEIGIRQVKFYLNGLLIAGEKRSRDTFAWSASSDELMKALPDGLYQLATTVENKAGSLTEREIQVRVGNVSRHARPDSWKDEIHQVLLMEGERMMAGDEIKLTRLECKLKVNDDGKMVLIDRGVKLIFKTWSKDDDGPHFATLEDGRLRCYRGTPENHEVVLWESPTPKSKGTGPCQLGITAGKRLIIYRETEGRPRTVVWMSPEPN